MNPSQKPFTINTGFLINQPIGYSRVLHFEFNEIDIEDDFLLKDVKGTIKLIRTHDGLRAQAVFDAQVESECGRCLEIFMNRIHSEFEQLFTFPYVESTEDEITVPENGNIDFKPILHDYLLMELPINPVCKPDCKGLCIICGQDLNQSPCEHIHADTAGEIREGTGKNDQLQKEIKTITRTT